MWLCFNDAFVSAVQDRNNPDGLCVRARKRAHLATLFPDKKIIENVGSDYACRVFVSKLEFAKLVSDRIQAIDYDNFKGSVSDHGLHDLYLDFWGLHRRYQVGRDRRNHLAWGPGDVEIHEPGDDAT